MTETRRTVTNTAARLQAPPWMGGVPPSMIEAQEARGQRELVESDVLPTANPEVWERLEAMGVVRGEQVPGDPLFTYCTLPDGWTKRAAPDHSMWSDLLDADGEAVAGIFYKAAYYDRKADMHPRGRTTG